MDQVFLSSHGRNPGPARQDQLRILQEHLGSLRRETEGWLDRQARVWQTAIAGVAAVFVLREDTELETFLPLAPILGVAVAAQWMSLLVMVIRAGRSMAVDEHRLNALVGGPPLLTHEIELWGRRSSRLNALYELRLQIVAGVAVLTFAYGALLWWLLQALDLSPEATMAYAVAAGLAFTLGLVNLVRLFRLRRLEEPVREARRPEHLTSDQALRHATGSGSSPVASAETAALKERPRLVTAGSVAVVAGLLGLVWRILRRKRSSTG
jgi:hypothetical protein